MYITEFYPCFCQTNGSELARKVIQDDEVTHTNLYEGPGMIFQPLFISFSTITELQTWGKVPHFLVYITVFSPCFCQTNRSEPARKVIQDDEVTHINLYEGPGMIFQPLLLRFGLLQSLRHGKKYLISKCT